MAGFSIEDVFKDICQPSVRIDIEPFTLVGEGKHDCGPLSAFMATGKKEIPETDSYGPDGILHRVVIYGAYRHTCSGPTSNAPESGTRRAVGQDLGHVAAKLEI